MKRNHGKLALAAVLASCMAQPSDAADKWSNQDIGLEVLYQVVHLADAATTADIHNHPDVKEVGPAGWFLGEQPDPTDTAVFFAATGALHAVVTHYLPSEFRPYWQAVTIGVSAGYAGNNYALGLRWGFK